MITMVSVTSYEVVQIQVGAVNFSGIRKKWMSWDVAGTQDILGQLHVTARPGATVTPFVPTAEGCRWHVNEHFWHAFRNQSNTGLCVAMAFMMMLLHIEECGCLGLVSVGVSLRNVMSMPFCPH